MFAPHFMLSYGELKTEYILTIMSFVVMVYNFKEYKEFLAVFKAELYFFMAVLFYAVLRSFAHGESGDNIEIIKHILCFTNLFLVVPFLIFVTRKHHLNTERQVINAIFIVSTLAAFISIMGAFYPPFDEYIRNYVMQYDEESYLMGNFSRGFGIASGLTSYYGYIQGTIVTMGIFYMKEIRWFLWFIPMVFFSALINARTGVLFSLWGVIVYCLLSRRQNVLFVLIITLLFFAYIAEIINALPLGDGTKSWILAFVEELNSIYSSGDISTGSTTSKLFGSMVVWPRDVAEWFIGRGYVLFRTASHTDVGWFLQLNYGGIFYLLLLYSAVGYMIKRLVANNLAMFALFFLGALVITNTKSIFYPGYGLFPFLTFIYSVKIIYKQNQDLKY